jgi:hypothetical protein
MPTPAAWSTPVNRALMTCPPGVGVEDLRRPVARQRLLQRLDAEVRVQRVRYRPNLAYEPLARLIASGPAR